MSDQHAHAFWVREPGQGEIRREDLPPPGADQLLVKALYSGISRGTETLVFQGRVPASEYARMRAPFQAGDFPAPVKYGYASVGRVSEGPAALRGREVFCLFPHQTRYRVPRDAVLALPDDVPAPRAVLAANMETAVNALMDVPPRVGDRMAVVGAGALGCLVAYLARQVPGVSVQLVDVNPARAEIAAALGVGFTTPDRASGERDLVVHTSATAAGLDTALALAAFEATVLELSWYGDGAISVALGGSFHSRRLRLVSSQVGALAADRRATRSHRQRLALALSLLRDPVLDVLITGENPFEDLPRVMQRLAAGDADPICHRIVYP